MGKIDFDLNQKARQAVQLATHSMPSVGASDTAYDQAARREGYLAAEPDPRFNREALLQAAIGRAVRDCRRKHDINGANLAKAAGISLGMLSRIETGAVSPSLSTLQALASALGIPVTALLRHYSEKNNAVFVKGNEAPTSHETHNDQSRRRKLRNDNPYRAFTLAGATRDALALESYLVTIHGHTADLPVSRRGGTQFVYCLEGEAIYSHGICHYHMAKGDSLLFNAQFPHGPSRLHKLPLLYLAINSFQNPQLRPPLPNHLVSRDYRVMT